MRILTLCSFLLLLTLLFSGCSSMSSGQKSLEETKHWNILANDVANRINDELIRSKHLHSPVYVRHSCGQPNACAPGSTFAFDEAFNDLLRTQLVNFGVAVLSAPTASSLLVEYKVQVLSHETWGFKKPKPGRLTALAAGVTVLRNVADDFLAGVALVDTISSSVTTKQSYEVIISTSILEKNQYISRSSDIYYISEADTWLYQQTAPPADLRLIDRSSSGSGRGDSAPATSYPATGVPFQ